MSEVTAATSTPPAPPKKTKPPASNAARLLNYRVGGHNPSTNGVSLEHLNNNLPYSSGGVKVKYLAVIVAGFLGIGPLVSGWFKEGGLVMKLESIMTGIFSLFLAGAALWLGRGGAPETVPEQLDDTVTKYVDKKLVTNPPKHSTDQVAFYKGKIKGQDTDHERDFLRALDDLKDKGGCITLYGGNGFGKDYLIESIPQTLQKRHNQKAEIWDVTWEGMQGKAGDITTSFGIKFGVTTVGLIREIVTASEKYYKETGIRVVLRLKDYEKVISAGSKANTVDPNNKSTPMQEFQRYIEEELPKTHTILTLTSNISSASAGVAGGRRGHDIRLEKRLTEQNRIKLLNQFLNEILQEHELQNGLSPDDILGLAKIGTVNLKEEYKGHSDILSRFRSLPDDELEKLDVITGDALRKAINSAVLSYKGDQTKSLKDLLASELNLLKANVLGQHRQILIDEIQQFCN